MKTISLLGSTGSIGTQTVAVVAQHPDKVTVHSLSAGQNARLLAEQVMQLSQWQKAPPQTVCLQNALAAEQFRSCLPNFKGQVVTGPEGLLQLAQDEAVQAVVVGLVGARGLPPSLAALQAGKSLLTANKETFVTGGHLVAPFLDRIVPIDSEHSAIFQCLQKTQTRYIREILLTASGGPFLNKPASEFAAIDKADALKHPNWVMGQKVTIDSATLMNKGLEVIEAHWLFQMPAEQIRVVIHPQSIVHSGVCFIDGSTLFQAGTPDMRVPIQVALAHPARWENDEAACHLDLTQVSPLTFEPPDIERFLCLGLAYEALSAGSGSTTALNAADEYAVEAFLRNEIRFVDIPRFIEQTLSAFLSQGFSQVPSLDEITAINEWVVQQRLPNLPAKVA